MPYPHRVTVAAAFVAAAACALPASPSPVALPARPVSVVAPVTTAPVTTPVAAPPVAPVPHVTHVAVRVAPAARPAVAPVRGWPFFRTPQRAMRYLAWAYSTKHDAAVATVTTPDGRRALLAMRGYAPAIGLRSCTRLPAGDYECLFWHSLAKHPGKTGTMTFRVAPAVRHGWYMTVLEACGDGESV